MSPVAHLADWRPPTTAARAEIVERFGATVRTFVDSWADAGASVRRIIAALESSVEITATTEEEARAQLVERFGPDAAEYTFVGEVPVSEK